MKTDPPVIARVRRALAAQVPAPLAVSTEWQQYYFDEDSAAYADIEVRDGDAFAVVIVRGGLPAEEFVVRVWHRYADEVWLIDSVEQVVFVVPRDGVIRVFAVGETLHSARLPDVRISIAEVFEITN